MNFLRRFYLEREARRLEDRLKVSPQANDIIKLVPIFSELGDIRRAEELRRKGKELFPSIDFSTVNIAKPEESPNFNINDEIEEVKLQMNEDPNPWVYGRLARLHVNAGKFEAAEKVALDAQKLFPTHPYSYVILAEICILRNDRVAAAKYYDYAVKLDNQSAVSIVNLSEYYQEIRDFDRTRKLLEHLLVPQRAMVAPTNAPPPVFTSAPESAYKQPKPAVKESALDHAIADAGKSSSVLTQINKLRTLRFLQGVVIADLDGNVLGSDLPYALEEDGVKSAQFNLWRTSMSQSEQMMLGKYFYTAFEGESGGFLIVQVPQCVIGLLFDKRRRLDQDAHEIFEFCKQVF